LLGTAVDNAKAEAQHGLGIHVRAGACVRTSLAARLESLATLSLSNLNLSPEAVADNLKLAGAADFRVEIGACQAGTPHHQHCGQSGYPIYEPFPGLDLADGLESHLIGQEQNFLGKYRPQPNPAEIARKQGECPARNGITVLGVPAIDFRLWFSQQHGRQRSETAAHALVIRGRRG
jgi:hypothetical protein